MSDLSARVPDAVQRESGAPQIRDPGFFPETRTGVPGLQCTTPLRSVLHLARDTSRRS